MQKLLQRISSRGVTFLAVLGSTLFPLIVQAQSTESYQKYNPYVVMLGDPSCGSSAGTWRQTSGPGSVILHSNRDRSYAKFYQSGQYTFQSSCCSASTSRTVTTTPQNNTSSSSLNRISRLMSSNDRVGFGSNTRGGAAARQYTVVTSLNNSGRGTLREAVEDQNGPTWIVFHDSIRGGTIYLTEILQFTKPQITIDAAGAGITIAARSGSSHPLFVFRGGNAIVHGLTFDGNGSNSTALMMREGDDYWIDHVTVTNFDDDGLTIGQGSKGSSSTSDVTISNYHARNTNYAILGGGENEIRNYPPYRVTIHSSILSADDRNPKIKNYGTAHVFNNYIHSFRFSALNAGANSRIYSEGNVFSTLRANNPSMALSGLTLNGGSPGLVLSRGDNLLGEASTTGNVRQTSSNNLPYSYQLKSANSVVDYVSVYAGAAGAALKLNNTIDASRSVQTQSVQTTADNSCSVATRRINFTRLQQ